MVAKGLSRFSIPFAIPSTILDLYNYFRHDASIVQINRAAPSAAQQLPTGYIMKPEAFEGYVLRLAKQNDVEFKRDSYPGMSRVLYRQLGEPADESMIDRDELLKLLLELREEQPTQFQNGPAELAFSRSRGVNHMTAVERLEQANAANVDRVQEKAKVEKDILTPSEKRMLEEGKISMWTLMQMVEERKERERGGKKKK
jgi:hypothetical protein